MAKRIERVDIESGDVFGGLKKSAKDANADVELLSKTLKVVSDEIESVKTKAKGLVIKMNPSNLADIEAQNKAEKEAIRLANERAKLETTQFRLATMKAKEQERLAKQQERQNKAQTAENSAYAQASKRLNELRKSYKDLAIQGRENESASKAMKKEIIELDAELKRVDASVGQYQRNVGNYSSAFSKLSGALGVFGVGLGLDAIVSGVTNFSREINEMNIQASRLGVSAENMKGFVSQAQSLGTTFGTDINDNMVSANALMKEFNITQEQAFKLMEQGYLSGANSQGDMLDSIKEYSSQIKASGGDANTLFNILNRSGKEGIFSDKGIDVVKEFGLRVREQTTATSDAMNNAFGKQFTDRIFKGINDGSMTSVEALEEVAKKMNDASIPTNKLQTVIADLFGGPGEDAGLRFIQTLTDISSETGNLVDKTDPYVRQQMEMKRLNEELAVAQQDLFEKLGGTGANMESLTLKAKVLFFQNILPAIGILSKLAIGFATFKTVTAVANTDFKALISNFTKFKVEADDAGGKMSGFGNALKGVGWTVAIGLAIELGMKLWDVASGAAAAREAMARFQQQVEKGSKESASNVASIQEAEKQIIAKLNEQLKNKKINQDEYNKAVKQAQINSENELKANIKSANERKRRYKDQLKELEQLQEKLDKSTSNDETIKAIDDLTKKATELGKELNITGNKAFGLLDQDATYVQVMAQLKANIAGTNERLKTYHGALKEADDATKDFTIQTSNGNKTLGDAKKAVKELTDEEKRRLQALKDLADFEQEQLDKQKAKDDARLARQDEYGQLLEEANKTTREFSMTEMEKELQAVEDKYRRMEDLSEEFGYGHEEILEARLNEENAIRAKYAQEEIKAEEEKQKELAEKEKEALEKRRQERRKFVSDVLDEMKELSQEEEKRIDDRIKAEQELQNNLQAQANAGNISAQQSIEASREAERKATLEKQKEQRKQQRIEDVKTLLNIINQNIDKGDSVPIATTKGIASLGIIKAVAKGLSGFAKGTEWRLGQEHKAQLSGVDGHIVKVDSSEAIVKGSLMDKAEKVGISSTDELVNLAVMQKMNDQTNGFQPSMTVGYKIDTSGIERRLQSIEKAIESKTETQFDPYILNGLAKGIVKTERKGNFTRKTLYKG